LYQASGLNVSDLDEPRVKEENVWLVEGDSFGVTFPFDGGCTASRVSVFVNVYPEFFKKY
jgi:hypothetical protein